MSKKHFSWLLGLTVVVAAFAILLPRETTHENSVHASALLPGLEDQVNTIDWLRISAGGEAVATLKRSDGQWVLEEAHGYSADWPELQKLLLDLSEAQVVEAKTANPAYYDRLGVEDPGSPGAAGVLVEFHQSTGLPALIIGNTAQGRGGQYLRLADSEQSVLIDRELEVSRSFEGWMDSEIIDIAEDEVVEVALTFADGESVLIRKISADDANFELQNIPEGFEPESNWSVNSLAGGLSSLTLDDVVPDTEFDWTGATRFRVVTAGGLNVEADLLPVTTEEGNPPEFWMRLDAGLYITTIDAGVDPDAGETTAQRAEAINARVSGWAYRIPQYKHDAMSKRMEGLVKKIEAES